MKRTIVVPFALGLACAIAYATGRPSERFRQKLVVLGFDGMDPELVSRWIDEGKLPNLRKLASQGGVYPIESTPSPEWPSAWASFATGSNAGRHRIYGAVARDAASYKPDAELVRREAARTVLGLVPVSSARFTAIRRGTSFWVHAGNAGARSSILAVPLTFPPEAVPNGEILSGAPLPPLAGFAYFGTDISRAEERDLDSGGTLTRLVFDGDVAKGELAGPLDPVDGARSLRLPFTIYWNRSGKTATVEIADSSIRLQEGEWSKWINLDFAAGLLTRVHGMAQFYLVRAAGDLGLYVSPINWKPDSPPAPMSWPTPLSADLYVRVGPYRTLGQPEATAALEENLLDEKVFLDDLYRAFDDRAQIILQRIDTHHWDLLVGVVDSIDRVQHVMWRLIDPSHPMYDRMLAAKFGDAIENAYRRADELVGEVMSHLEPGTPMLVLSAYGFHSFRRAVNLNAWLAQEGFLAVRAGRVDWPHTKAYAIGSGQIYLNLSGREGQGIVWRGVQARAVEDELIARLTNMTDRATGARVVRAVYKRDDLYSGPYFDEAPDLQVGFADGYGMSPETTLDAAASAAIVPNMRRWSGDHAGFDYKATPGVLISSRPIDVGQARIVDIAPTVLKYFGVPIPPEIDGKSLF